MATSRVSTLIASTLALLGTLALVACSTTGAATTSTGGGTSTVAAGTATSSSKALPTNLTDYCNLVSLVEVSQATGLTITQVTPIPNQARQEIICGYAASVATSTGAVIIFIVSPNAGQAQTVYAALKQQAQSKGATVAVLNGIDDQAFSTSQNGVDSVVALKGTVVFLVSGTTPHPLPLAVDKSLAQLVASKL
jgi:hypothetical protein